MKRAITLSLAVLAFALLAAGAQAASVSSKRVTQTRADVKAYWTAARMRDAKPASRQPSPLAKPGTGGGTKAGAATEITTSYTVFPTSTNGKVFFTDDRVNYVCSGTAISSANASVVWTAGHCVNQGPGAFHTNWMFVPAYKDGAAPLGSWPASSLYTTSQWSTQGDFSYDLGAAVVAPDGSATPLTTAIGGGRTLGFNGPRSQRYNSFGYPAASPFNGQRLWMCDSSLYTSDTRTSPQTMGIQCNMTGGSSGGGWVGALDGKVWSVNSYGYSNLRNVMFGPYQGTVAQSLFETAEAAPPS